MTIGIYCITHDESGMRYIGKSVNVEKRLIAHKHILTKIPRDKKATNRYLYNAVQKYGWNAFSTTIVETFNIIDESMIAERELYWMDYYKTYDRSHGYNLRRDSSTKMIVHPETRILQSKTHKGRANPNFGNSWTNEMKRNMSNIAKRRHDEGKYDDSWREKISNASRSFWKNNPDTKEQMARKVAKAKLKYRFHQLTKGDEFIKEWDTVKDIIKENPTWKWQNIYSVCNGYKETIYGYKWRKVPREGETEGGL